MTVKTASLILDSVKCGMLAEFASCRMVAKSNPTGILTSSTYPMLRKIGARSVRCDSVAITTKTYFTG